MIARISIRSGLSKSAFKYCNVTVSTYILFIWIFAHFTYAGKPTEERMLMRIRDDPSLVAEDTQADAEVDDLSGDRSRRQLPTEINIQVTAPLFTARLYDYGVNDGDKEVPPSIDVGIKFDLKQPLTFFDQKFNELYILSNGGIGFEANSRNYKSDVFHGGPVLIAPLWNRNDLRKGGKIFYREVTEGRAIERAQSEVRYQYDKVIKPISVLLVTWEHMQPMGEQNLKDDNSNTFQAAIISSDNGTFANFIFKNIGWTQGAEAGFSKGDSKNFYSLPTSGTSNIMYLKDNGNTGIPGEWMFEIGQARMIRCKPGIKGDTCDDECAEFEWGNDCEKCCHCGKGRCNVNTGECQGECRQCWKNPPHCDKRESDCKAKAKECGYNAISFTDYDKCGEAVVRCQCLSGYVGDGFNCTDVDECSKPNTCSPAANCYNTPGRYYCECQTGFTGNGTVCTASSSAGGVTGGGISISSLNRTSTQVPIGVATTLPPSNEPSTPTTQPTGATTTPPSGTGAAPTGTPAAPGLGIQFLTVTPSSSTAATSIPSGGGIQLITGGAHAPIPQQNQSQLPPQSQPRSTQPTQPALQTEQTQPPSPTSPSPPSIQPQTQSPPPLLPLQPQTTTQPQETTSTSTLAPTLATVARVEEPARTSPRTQYPDSVQALPKETYSQITYRMRQPMTIFGKKRDHLVISSIGLVSLDDVPPVTPEDDLEELGVSGFAPFFGKIDLAQPGVGAVTIRETSHSYVLTDATSLIDNYFHSPGFMAKSVLTVSFDNVTTAGKQEKNNFQIVLIAGNNALGENVTFVEYAYSNIQWSDGAQAVIMADDASNSVQLPGSGSEGVRQLSQLSNIGEPGQWIYRVDLERVTCPQTNLLPPYCNSETPGWQQSSPNESQQSVPSVQFGLATSPPNNVDSIAEDSTSVLPPLQIFTTTKKQPRPPVPTRPPGPRIVIATTPAFGGPPRRGPSNINVNNNNNYQNIAGDTEELDSLNSPSKLAIIIPTAIVGVWLLLLMLIGIVVCCKRRSNRRRMRTKYDPAYHFRHMPSIAAAPRGKDASGVAAAAAASTAQASSVYPQPHVTYEDHLEKAARLSEMSQYGQNGNRVSMYGSYWNMPSTSRQYSYYNQGYYESCPEFQQNNRGSYYNGRY